jgi:pyridoxamine 5'-phosphate oxidase
MPKPPYDDPFEWLRVWMNEAEQAEPRVANAMQLATTNAEGHPAIRTVLLKDYGEDGLVFFTNLESPKAQELTTTPFASICLHWKSLKRQVIAAGKVSRLVPDKEEAYFASSQQSRPLQSRSLLMEMVEAKRMEFSGKSIPKPESWGGYLLDVHQIEFWAHQEGRLHDRWCFYRDKTRSFSKQRVFP